MPPKKRANTAEPAAAEQTPIAAKPRKKRAVAAANPAMAEQPSAAKPRKKRAAAAAEPAVAELPLEWEQWLGQIERLFLAFITVGALFEQRDAPGSLSGIRAAVEQQAKLPFEETSLQLIASLRTDLVVLGQFLPDGRPSAEPVWRLHFAASRKKAAKTAAGFRYVAL